MFLKQLVEYFTCEVILGVRLRFDLDICRVSEFKRRIFFIVSSFLVLNSSHKFDENFVSDSQKK